MLRRRAISDLLTPAKALFLPSRIPKAPDKFDLRLQAFGRNCLLQRENFVIALDGLTMLSFGRRPGLPLVLDVPVEEVRDFRVFFNPLDTQELLAVMNFNLAL
jgi:hypothetical protein